MRKLLLDAAAFYMVTSLFVAGLLLVDLWPWHPGSAAGWALLLIGALPVLALFEGLGETILRNNPVPRAVEYRTRHSEFSLLRIGYALFVMLALFVVIVVAVQWAASSELGDFARTALHPRGPGS